MIYLGLGALALVIFALVLSDGSDNVVGGLTPDMLGNLAWTGIVLALVAAGYWRRVRAAPLQSIQALAAWAMIGAALVIGYTYREQLQGVSSRVVGELRPGTVVSGPGGIETVTRRSDGTFQVEAEVNGRQQDFMFDTGAGSVILTAENAAALGLAPRPEDFITRISTANGLSKAAPIQLDSLRVGTIAMRRVNALVARPGALNGNLLGQTFLDRLAGYEVQGNRLVLRPVQ